MLDLPPGGSHQGLGTAGAVVVSAIISTLVAHRFFSRPVHASD